MKPCGACCLRGTPSECEYGGSKQDHHYIEQSAVIENLSQVCDSLKRELEETRRRANLPVIKQEGERSWSPSSSDSGHSEEKEETVAGPDVAEEKQKEVIEPTESPEAKHNDIILQKTGMRPAASFFTYDTADRPRHITRVLPKGGVKPVKSIHGSRIGRAVHRTDD